MALQKTDESPVGLGEHVERSPRGGFVQTRTASRAANSPTEANGTAGHTGAPARSGWRAAAGFLAVFTALLALPLQTQAQSTDATLDYLYVQSTPALPSSPVRTSIPIPSPTRRRWSTGSTRW